MTKTVAITGGARGIGLATAKALTAAGARVAIGDIDGDEAIRAANGIGDSALPAQLDVTDSGSFRAFLELVERELGPLDVLVNNAGIMHIGPFLEEPEAFAERTVKINVLGAMTGMKLALPGMLQRGHGQIVNVASVAGKTAVPGGASYAASKAAVVSLTETARVEFRGKGIDFTCVMPSFTATELIAGTTGTRFVKTISPDGVGAAIATAVAEPRDDVYVPKSVGSIIKLNSLLGRKVRDAMGRALGADRTFLDFDRDARASYEARITGPPDPVAAPAAGESPAARR